MNGLPFARVLAEINAVRVSASTGCARRSLVSSPTRGGPDSWRLQLSRGFLASACPPRQSTPLMYDIAPTDGYQRIIINISIRAARLALPGDGPRLSLIHISEPTRQA